MSAPTTPVDDEENTSIRTADDGGEGILVQNVYYMLAYAYRLLSVKDLVSVNAEMFDKVHDLFAALLAEALKRQVKQGLYRSYQDVSDALPTIRGRINLGETMRRQIQRQRLIACEFDELSASNLLNQIVKVAATILSTHPDVKHQHRQELRRSLMFFADVSDINPARIPWTQIRLTPHTQSYRLLLAVSHLLLESMIMGEEDGQYRLGKIIDDQQMSTLYERFIYEYFAFEWPVLGASAPHIRWALDDDANALLPTMRSDLVLTTEDRKVIIDAKYYTRNMQRHYDRHSVHSANLYQIFTYVKNAQAVEQRRVSGMLLYARTGVDQQPHADYMMSGNAISVRTLDLSQPWLGIKRQLDAVAHALMGGK